VEAGAAIGAQAYDIARVGWNFRPVKNQVKHWRR
jgi:hypothetical protein